MVVSGWAQRGLNNFKGNHPLFLFLTEKEERERERILFKRTLAEGF